MNSFNYNSPILGQMRSGLGNDPYIPYTNVPFKVINGKVQLTEIPDEFHRVQVAEGITYYNEVIQTVPVNLQFSVDYNLGLISFHASAEGKTLSFTYYGRGALFFPVDRIWTKAENGNVVETLNEIIEAGQEAIIAIPELLETIAESEEATDAANTAASYANSKGDYAQTQGDYALAKGNDANTAASAANTTNTAVQAAEAIRVASEITRVNQESARVNAEASRVAVESDRVNAEASRVTAELARVSAEISRVNVEANRVNKELARVAAETARDDAEVIRLASEAARVNEENTRLSSETTRLANESDRVVQELARVSAESNRVTVELVRVAAESARVTVEANRVTSESERVNAETSRVDAESARVAEELLRVGAETSRVNAELARVNEEASRVTAELVRVNAESIRISAEQDRLDTEVLRDSYESTRENNEITRISNETARALAEDSRNNTEGNRVLSETNRESAENIRQDGYEAFMLLEDYNNAHSYVPLNKVVYIGSTYQCILATTGNLPTDTAYWIKIAQRGLDGAGTVTDITSPNSDIAIGGTPDHPTIIANSGTTANKLLKLDSNAEFPATLVKQDSSHRMISDSKITEWDGKQDALGFTPASLDNNGKIPLSQIPDDVITSLDWNDITNKPTSTVVEIDEAVVKVNDIGDKANLETSVRTDLVSAINEINASAGGKLVMLKNTVNVTTASSSVDIGIASFNKDNDMIMVYENSVYIEKDIDYTISNDSLQLQKTGNWIVGTHLNIIIFKNISTTVSMIDGSQIEDGSIKDIKLHSENKIGKLTNLLTTNKTSVVSAINELFQSGSEFKGDVAAAITAKGRPTAANDPKQIFINNINSITTATGNAIAANVLAGKTFSNASGNQVGTMPKIPYVWTPRSDTRVDLPAGYYDGTTYIQRVNIDFAKVLGGYEILEGTGTMPDNGIKLITPDKLDIPIAVGYYGAGSKVYGDANLVPANIRKDVEIFGYIGTYDYALENLSANYSRFDGGASRVGFNFDFNPSSYEGFVKAIGMSIKIDDVNIGGSNVVTPSTWRFPDADDRSATILVTIGAQLFRFYVEILNWTNSIISGTLYCQQIDGTPVDLSALNPVAKQPNINFIYMKQ
ncbi:hypothetical protein [Paenibacillus sp. FSL H7-0331]|uniref:hypothetical protein n=1 Tax=Paenibacillus sp. FSL H7-0331 TaxID=1920421 RepID=UPI00096E0E22|nr:hypothetical protein [Paenibacillus sp. FSL H7-0331]OMF11903.1 hypothetical protein BK127_23400 [Paenibacillus sp. FSL H7-0331]